MTFRFFAGSYCTGSERGIRELELDTDDEVIREVRAISGVENPSFLSYDRGRDRLYAVSETSTDGHVVSFARNGDAWRETGRAATGGDYPCFLHAEASGRWLLGVNYMSGSLFVFSLRDDGSIGARTDFRALSGSGKDSERQEGPHPHSIWPIPGTERWLVPDLGSDRLRIYRLTDDGRLAGESEAATAPGSGPRHAAFSPSRQVVYVAQELGSTVAVYAYDAGGTALRKIQDDITTLPRSYAGVNLVADIHLAPSGDFLYVSNRGNDSLAIYRVMPDGTIEPHGFAATGPTPRSFLAAAETPFLLVAAQDGNEIALMERQPGGAVVAAGVRFEMRAPVCLIDAITNRKAGDR